MTAHSNKKQSSDERREKAREYNKKYYYNNRNKILIKQKEKRDKENFMEEPGSWMPPYNLEELELITSGELSPAESAEMLARSRAGVASKIWRLKHPEWVKAYNRAAGRRKTILKRLDYSFELSLKAHGLWNHWDNCPKSRDELSDEQYELLATLRSVAQTKKDDLGRICDIIKNTMNGKLATATT